MEQPPDSGASSPFAATPRADSDARSTGSGHQYELYSYLRQWRWIRRQHRRLARDMGLGNPMPLPPQQVALVFKADDSKSDGRASPAVAASWEDWGEESSAAAVAESKSEKQEDALGWRAPPVVESLLADLRRLLQGAHLTQEASPRLRARVTAYGEMMSSAMGAALLRSRGMGVARVDARSLLRSVHDAPSAGAGAPSAQRDAWQGFGGSKDVLFEGELEEQAAAAAAGNSGGGAAAGAGDHSSRRHSSQDLLRAAVLRASQSDPQLSSGGAGAGAGVGSGNVGLALGGGLGDDPNTPGGMHPHPIASPGYGATHPPGAIGPNFMLNGPAPGSDDGEEDEDDGAVRDMHDVYLEANVFPRSAVDRAEAASRNQEVVLTQGFIASTPSGDTCLLGRGGSDTSAALFAALIQARKLEIWTDVHGMFTADPRRVSAARLLRHMSYREAQELAAMGAKVLHPRCLGPASRAGVPVEIRNTMDPKAGGTWIGPKRRPARRARERRQEGWEDSRTGDDDGDDGAPRFDDWGRGGGDDGNSTVGSGSVATSLDGTAYYDDGIDTPYGFPPPLGSSAEGAKGASSKEGSPLLPASAGSHTYLPGLDGNTLQQAPDHRADGGGGDGGHGRSTKPPLVLAVARRKDVILLTVSTFGMWGAVGFLAKVFNVFAQHQVSVDLLATSQYAVSITLESVPGGLHGPQLRRLTASLSKLARVVVRSPCSVVSVVGRRLRMALPRLGRAMEALDGVAVHMVSEAAEDLNMSFVVDEGRADSLVASLHGALLEHGGRAYTGSEEAPADDIEDASLFGPRWMDLVAAGKTSPSAVMLQVPPADAGQGGPGPLYLEPSSVGSAGAADPAATEDSSVRSEQNAPHAGAGAGQAPSAPSPQRAAPPRPPAAAGSSTEAAPEAPSGTSADSACPAKDQCEDPWWSQPEAANRIAQSLAATERVESRGGSGAAFVYDLAVLRRRAQRLLGALTVTAGGGLFYAVKANDSAEVLRALAVLGIGMECVSEQEVRLALRAARETGMLPGLAQGTGSAGADCGEPVKPASLLSGGASSSPRSVAAAVTGAKAGHGEVGGTAGGRAGAMSSGSASTGEASSGGTRFRIQFSPNLCSVEEAARVIRAVYAENQRVMGPAAATAAGSSGDAAPAAPATSSPGPIQLDLVLDGADIVAGLGPVLAGQRVAVRVDPEGSLTDSSSGNTEAAADAVHHKKVLTAGPKQKFGCDEGDVPAAVQAVLDAGGVLTGLHAHVGSGVLKPRLWSLVAARLAAVALRLPTRAVQQLEWVGLGGGLGVVEKAGQEPLDVAAVNREIQGALAGPRFQELLYKRGGAAAEGGDGEHRPLVVRMEPGRYCIAPAGVLAARVTRVKQKHGLTFVGLAAGMNALIRPALYGANHAVANLSRLGEQHSMRCVAAGPICESADVVCEQALLPASTAPGDIAVVVNAGAYGRVMASTYNAREVPASVFLGRA